MPKYISIFLLAVTISCSSEKPNIKTKERQIERVTINDSISQKISYFKNGSKKRIETIKNDSINGDLIDYYSSGSIKEYNYIDGYSNECESGCLNIEFSIQFDTLGEIKSRYGSPIIKSEIDSSKLKSNDLIVIKSILAKPPNLKTTYEIRQIFNDKDKKIKWVENNSSLQIDTIKFQEPGKRDVIINYYLNTEADTIIQYYRIHPEIGSN